MPDFLKRMGVPITFAVLALFATVVMVGDRRDLSAERGDLPWWQAGLYDLAAPLQRIIAAPFTGVRGLWNDYVDLLHVREENARLRELLAEVQDESLQYQEALVASGHLQRIAEMRRDFEIPMLPGEVVGLDVAPWFRSILVNRGSSKGIQVGNPVITAQGVVGMVTATSGNASKTMLVLDRQSAVDAIVQRSRARGVVRGQGSDELRFEFVVRGGDVRVGDVVITSGLGGVYPKGLRIGNVVEVPDPGGSLVQAATLQPTADFGRLEQVFVMLHRGPTTELLYGPNPPVEPQEPAPTPTVARSEKGVGEVDDAGEPTS